MSRRQQRQVDKAGINPSNLLLQFTVPLLRDYFVPLPSWNHLDFIYGKDIYTYVHQEILKILQSTY
uniref:Uncharacterized protein n=1 Tax=Tetranychus urticae TaxID=32264 RepID=T1KXP0_TETUR